MNYQFKTDYKNIEKTILLALLVGIFCYLFSLILIPDSPLIQKLTGITLGLISLLLIGRSIIVRHEIRKNNSIIVEFLLRPKHKVVFGPDKVNKIKYIEINWGRYGRFTKGIIEFNDNTNNQPLKLKDFIESELTWFYLK